MTERAPHLGFVTDEIHPGTAGGIGRLLNASAAALDAAGFRQTFLVTAPSAAADEFRRFAQGSLPGTRVVQLDEYLGEPGPLVSPPLWAFHFPAYHTSHRVALALQRLLRESPMDGIEFNDYRGLGYVPIKWRRLWGEEFEGTRMWVRLHGTNEAALAADRARFFSREQEMLFMMERYALRHADGWMAPSEAVLAAYRATHEPRDMPGIAGPPAFETIGSGNTHPRQRGVSPRRILFYGKLQRLKGPDLLVRAAVNLLTEEPSRELEFLFAGGDVPDPWSGESFEGELTRVIPEPLRPHFRFLGRIAPAELATLAASAALAVVPSRMETFCLAAHELNWIGIPLVLSDLPAFRAFFEDGRNARFFDGTADGLTAVLADLLDADEPFAGWSWNAAAIAARADPPALYRRALATFAPPGAARVDAAPGGAGRPAAAPLVSVVMPYYETHPWVDAAIESVRASRGVSWELILVNDGTPSAEARATLAAIRAAAAADPRIRVIDKPNGGLGSARNAGIDESRGDFILPLDSDDVIHPDYLALAVGALLRAPELDAVSSMVNFFDDGTGPDAAVDYVIPYDLDPRLITLENRAGTAGSVFRRRVFEHHRYAEDLASYEDWEFWWQLAAGGAKAEVLPRILYHYRRRAASLMRTTAAARHDQLLHDIAERHGEHLTRHASAVVRLYMRRVAELRAENDALRRGAGGQIQLIVRRLYDEARALRRRRRPLGARLATLGAPRGSGAAARPVRRLWRLETLGAARDGMPGGEAWFGGWRDGGSAVYRLSDLRLAGAWKRRPVDHPFVREALVAVAPGASLSAQAFGDEIGVALLHHPWSGRVRITVGGTACELDLYAPESESGFREYRWSEAGWQPCHLVF